MGRLGRRQPMRRTQAVRVSLKLVGTSGRVRRPGGAYQPTSVGHHDAAQLVRRAEACERRHQRAPVRHGMSVVCGVQ
jgi:hypothetical protein